MEKNDQLAIVSENQLILENREAMNVFLDAATAKNTRRAYKADWTGFVTWCSKNSARAMPAAENTVAIYLTHLATAGKWKATTIRRKAIAIGQAHCALGVPSPTDSRLVRTVLRGIARELGTEPKKARPTMANDIRAMVDWISSSYDCQVRAQRDRALLLLGFSGAFRRSELVSLDVKDLEFVDDGVVVRLHGSKTDQEKKGTAKGIPLATPKWCPVVALDSWLTSACRTTGPVFVGMDRWGNITEKRLSDRAVARIVQAAALGIGKNPKLYSGHSLRAGLATAAAAAGKSERAIMNQTGHKSVITVREYIREGHLFVSNAADGLL